MPSGAPRTFTLAGGTTERASVSFLLDLVHPRAPGRPAPEGSMNVTWGQAWRSGGGTALEERGTVPDDQVLALSPCPSGEI